MHGHHLSELGTMHRAAVAKDLGLDPKDYVSPFEGGKTVTNINYSNGGILKNAALIAGLLGSGGLVGLLISDKINPNPPTQIQQPQQQINESVPPPVSVEPPKVKVDDIHLKIDWWVEGDEVDQSVQQIDE